LNLNKKNIRKDKMLLIILVSVVISVTVLLTYRSFYPTTKDTDDRSLMNTFIFMLVMITSFVLQWFMLGRSTLPSGLFGKTTVGGGGFANDPYNGALDEIQTGDAPF
jgi:hypothetical protein